MSDSDNDSSSASEKENKESEKEESKKEVIVDTSQLKEKVTAYIKIDDLIKNKRREIKELNEKKIEFEEYIKKYLTDSNKTKIETTDGDIVFKKQTTKTPLKEDLVEKAIVNKFKDTKKITESGVKIAHDIIEDVNNMRGVNIKNNIRRVKKRASAKK